MSHSCMYAVCRMIQFSDYNTNYVQFSMNIKKMISNKRKTQSLVKQFLVSLGWIINCCDTYGSIYEIAVMSAKLWILAVWLEKKQEEEGVIPTHWIKEHKVRWPNGSNAIRAMRNRLEPGEKWLLFQLIKIKHQSCK